MTFCRPIISHITLVKLRQKRKGLIKEERGIFSNKDNEWYPWERFYIQVIFEIPVLSK